MSWTVLLTEPLVSAASRTWNCMGFDANTLWPQVAPFRKLRQEKIRGRRAKMTEYLYYDFRQMHTAFTGTVPIIGEANPYSDMVCTPPCAPTPSRHKHCKLPCTRMCLRSGETQSSRTT